MSDRTSSRRQFLKGLGMVTGAFATGAFALNSSANEEGVAYNETPSGIPCFYIDIVEDKSGLIPKPNSNNVFVYHVQFVYQTVCNGVRGVKTDLVIGNFVDEKTGKDEKARKLAEMTTELKKYCRC